MSDNRDSITNNDSSPDVSDGFNLSCLKKAKKPSKPKNTVNMVVGRDEMFYRLNHRQRGVAVIFNHEHFLISQLKQRLGTNEDKANLRRTFERLGFTVYSYDDLTTPELFELVDKFASMDHSENDCFVMCILTHGDEGCLYSKNTPYKHDDIFCRFTASQCKSLAGKPKLFFIQACQGDRLDPGVTVVQTDSAPGSYRIPVYADFLIAYSTIPGHYSWRNTTRGSWFVQALCHVLTEQGYQHDLLTLLTLVNQRVALDFESNVPGDRKMHAQKQIPCITFMLTRIFKFPQPALGPSAS